MRSSRFIVCEQSPKWAIALRRELSPIGLRVYETRGLEHSWQELVEHPASMLAVEVTGANLESLTAWLHRLVVSFPYARVVVLGDKGMESIEWLLREVGAVHVVFSPRELAPVARMADRHVTDMPEIDRVFNNKSVRQAVWAALPWSST